MSFTSNLFGTIAEQSIAGLKGIGFFPNGSNGEVINIKDGRASWLGMQSKDMQKYAYEFCYPVACVVDRLAEMDLTGEVEILKTDSEVEDDYATSTWAQKIKARLSQPNILQSWEQFRGQQLVYKRVFGYCPVLPIVPVGMPPEYCTAMINLPPWLFNVVHNPRGNIITATTINELVKEYTMNLQGNVIHLQPEWVIILEDSFMQDEGTKLILPQSKLVGLDMQISNICAALEADNVLLRKRGPLGFISHDPGSKDNVSGYLPMEVEDKEELQTDLQKYGLSWSQFQYVISRTPIRWNSMSYDVNELGTKATVVAGEEAICHRYGFPYIMYKESDATYANGAQAATNVYFNVVIPNANKDAGKYNKFFKAEENKAAISFCFDDVPFLQDDEMASANARKARNESLMIEYQNNLITLNQWRQEMGYDTVVGDDTYLRDSQTQATI